ncbi:MAG: hypothetical protein IKD62_02845 [Oscillospiraceae bacterium]|nr:hypothetical protein [Oscillospiraceae bacterium]
MVTLLNLMQEDPELLSNIVLPEGVDRETLVNQILFEGCTLFPIYQDPKLFKAMAEHYFRMREQIHAELFKTLEYKYDPLENYDRTEDRTHSGNENINRNLATEETAGTGTTSNGKTEEKVSAFNEDGYQPQNLSESESTMNSNTDTEGSEDETTARTHSGTEHTRIHGNIGVTTSQQMLEAQRGVVQFSLYEFIAAHFLTKFMIGIY